MTKIRPERPSTLPEPSGFDSRADIPSSRPSARLGDALATMLRLIARESDREGAAAAMTETLVEELGAVAAVVYFAEADGRTLRLAASRQLQSACAELAVVEVAASSLPAARAARTRALQLVGNVNPSSTRTRDPRTLARTGTSVAFALPLLVGDRLLGVLSAQLAAGLDPADLETLASLGVVLGVVLDRARLMAEARAREEWTRLVAHELRQPLQAIAFHARAGARAAECGCVSAADRVIDRVRRIDRITGDLLDTSLDIAKVCLFRRPTDLTRLATGLVTPSDAPTGRVRMEARGEIPEIEVDPARIEQILVNLIGNAVKYGRPDSEIELLLERTEDEVVVSVRNVGEDIPEQERARIFDRHYRAREDMAVGWGIGLYVCRGLAEAHGGRIAVESGGGSTTFSLRLPQRRP